MRLAALSIALVAACSHAPAPNPAPEPAPPRRASEGQELIGTTPPEWEATHWLNSPPLTLAGLRGKVVLARWWTAGCRYCQATAPSLRALDRDYRDKGLAVIGFYHVKDDPISAFETTAKKYEFTFPLAVDTDWKTLDRWWEPKAKHRSWTSVSFLLDKRGVIRHVHEGGRYVRGDGEFETMQAQIEKLLAEPN